MNNGYLASNPIIDKMNKDLGLTTSMDVGDINSVKTSLRNVDNGSLHKLNYLRMIKLHCDMLMELAFE